MKIFSKNRRKLEPYRRFGSREFKDKLLHAKNYKRSLNPNSKKGFFPALFSRAGLSMTAVLMLLVLFGTVFYFLILSPYFLVTEISINGNKQVSTDEIKSAIASAENHRFLLVKENHLIMLNSGRVSKLVTSALPLVKEVKSTRAWPNKLKVEITERVPTLTLVANEKNYLIDDQGFVVREMPDAGNFLKVQDQVNEDIKVGETIDGKLIPFIISLKQIWPTKFTQPIATVKIPGKGASEVEFLSSEGWSVFFSTDRPVSSQMSSLLLLMNKQIGTNRSNLAYIDLRLAKWAYYCLKATPCQQTDQPTDSTQNVENPTQTSGTEVQKP